MSKELKEEFSKLKSEALEVVKKAQDEKRDLTAEEKAGNEQRFNRCDTIKRQLDEQKRFAEMAVADLPAEVLAVAKGNQSNPAKAEFSSHTPGLFTPEQHKAAVNQYIRTGTVPHEMFTITAGSGGVTLPVVDVVVIKRNPNPFKAALQAYGLNVLNIPSYGNVAVFDDSGNVADVISQSSNRENIKEPTLTSLLPGNVLFDSGTTWVANTLLQQAQFDVLGAFRPMMDKRIEEKETNAWSTSITGTGTVGVTTASTAGVTFQELVALKYSLPAAMQNDAVFVMSRGLMRIVESLVDANGRPIFRDSLSDDAPDRLLGYPVFLSDALADPAAGAVSGFIASASSLIVAEYGPRRVYIYQNYPLRPDQTGIREFANGGMSFVGNGVKVLKHAAS